MDAPLRRIATWSRVWWVAAVLRVAMVVYGEWHDHNMSVPYTDIDYRVFTDAAQAVVNGQPPYARPTYRYPPLLAWLLVPNIVVHRVWGKLLFVCGDMAVGWLVHRMSLQRGARPSDAALRAALFLFNPVTIGVATRGSSDTLVAAVVLASLLRLRRGHLVPSAGLLALAVHLKLYPIIYAVPVGLFVLLRSSDTVAAGAQSVALYAAVATGILAVFTGLCYALYGRQFLDEAYLYHFSRVDVRHNFSVWFYPLYLTIGTPEAQSLLAVASSAQAFLTLGLGAVFYADPVFAVAVQTVAFVALNKVITAQYFVWFFALLPVVVPLDRRTLYVFVGWLACELHWLYQAYGLEFLGLSNHWKVWVASCVFLAAQGGGLWLLLWTYTPPAEHRPTGGSKRRE